MGPRRAHDSGEQAAAEPLGAAVELRGAAGEHGAAGRGGSERADACVEPQDARRSPVGPP